jgi:hypothetical protein
MRGQGRDQFWDRKFIPQFLFGRKFFLVGTMWRVSKLILRRMPTSGLFLFIAFASAGLTTQASAEASTTASIVSLQNPSRVGDTVEFAVTVSGAGGDPTGTVTLDAGDGTSVFGALSGGEVKVHHTYATAGIFLVIVSYNGDANNLPSVNAIAQTVGKAVTISSLGSLQLPISDRLTPGQCGPNRQGPAKFRSAPLREPLARIVHRGCVPDCAMALQKFDSAMPWRRLPPARPA